MPPAARIGDQTAHGGAITGPGALNVLVGGKPAARVGDMAMCPLFSGNVSHGVGPIGPPGCPTVLIGGVPAARVGDQVMELTGGPAPIVVGEPTVLLGDG